MKREDTRRYIPVDISLAGVEANTLESRHQLLLGQLAIVVDIKLPAMTKIVNKDRTEESYLK